MVIFEDPPAVIGLGLKLTVVPEGWPLALRLTLWAEPLVTAVEIVEVPLEPGATVKLLGLALIEKSLLLTTVSVTFVVCVALVPVPVTVIV